ncbi:hypothetical protein LCGC14_1487180 [marine sediment metagenome]|uniref:Uncharacterized protein n=1 Tax=marine sediment metagenome TaxID=412755 RepID=A0A0F9M9R2_9ZZZZ
MRDIFGLGMMAGAVIMGVTFLICGWYFNPPKLHDRENKIVRWDGQLYRLVPVEKKIEYVKPEAK